MYMKKIICIIAVLFYSTSIYSEVYTYFLRNGLYLQIRTLENITLQYLVNNPNFPFVLLLLTPNCHPKTITDLGFSFYGLDSDNQPLVIHSLLKDFLSFLSFLPTLNPIFLSEDLISLLNYDSITQANYVCTNFAELSDCTSLTNQLLVIDNTGIEDHLFYTGSYNVPLETDHFNVPVPVGTSQLLCIYGCPYRPKSSADSAQHNMQYHWDDKEKIKSLLGLCSKCPLCNKEIKFHSFRSFSNHMKSHKEFNYKDFLDSMKSLNKPHNR